MKVFQSAWYQMKHKIKYKFNRIKYYILLLDWARKNQDNVLNYKFLLNLKNTCHDNFLEAERKEDTHNKEKAKIQEELLERILNNIHWKFYE